LEVTGLRLGLRLLETERRVAAGDRAAAGGGAGGGGGGGGGGDWLGTGGQRRRVAGSGDGIGAADRRSVPAVESDRRRRTAAVPGTGDQCGREGGRVGAGGRCRRSAPEPEVGPGGWVGSAPTVGYGDGGR
ncbi:glycine-rich cell wall structural protein 1.8-like, partial [Capsicum annuum]|uniref:glycine-rich cell wall structural protein 1.8-like n=1 Tax=Capsicum annuum TaxID=4072 RepID=UPI001FB16F99